MADRTPSLADEARHLHACLFRAPIDAVVIARYEAAQAHLYRDSPETFHPGTDSKEPVGQAGSLRPIGNRPVFVERTASSSTVSVARDAPAGIVFRSSPNVREKCALSNPSLLVARIVARRLDAEAVEFALRRRGLGRDLARRMQVLCYLVEVRPGCLAEFVNGESSRGRAWAALTWAALRSGWKRIKGEYLVRRHGLA